MFDYRAFLEKGVLPQAGGLDDQHPLYIESMRAMMDQEGVIHSKITADSWRKRREQEDRDRAHKEREEAGF